MAFLTTKKSLCRACSTAPSVFFCQGCQKGFCTDHARKHRLKLSKQLDTIIVEHDQLTQNLAEYIRKSRRHPLMKQIDQWEAESIDKIRTAANDARKQVSNVLDSHTSNLTKDLKQLTRELKTAQSQNNFIETDLNEWMERLEKWTKDLSTPSSISIQRENSDKLFIKKIIVSLKANEFFEKFAGKIKIEENGQVITAQSDGHSTARCHGAYSSGQYNFRFLIEQKDKRNWIYFGIVSQFVPLQKNASYTSTTFGWVTDDDMSLNDSDTSENEDDKTDYDVYELFLDCDRRRICLTNKTTHNKHELAIDITQCPFPWQIHIGLYFKNDRVRYLPL